MKIEPIIMDWISQESDINYLMLLIRQMVYERSQYKIGYKAIELGVRTGNSTASILAGLVRSGTGGRLASCDIDPCDGAVAALRPLWGDIWKFSQMDSIAFSYLLENQSPDLVFIDTDHTLETTRQELKVWSDLLVPGGRILLHDTRSRPEGVGQAIKEFVKANPSWQYYDIDVCCGLGVLDKP